MSLKPFEREALKKLREALKTALQAAKDAQCSVTTDYTAGVAMRYIENAIGEVERELVD